MNRSHGLYFIMALAAIGATGCSKRAVVEQRDIGPVAAAYYKAHPEIFHFATPADLPTNLVWQDGTGVPEFSAPEARRGGTLNFWIDDFPRTLRFAGNDTNGSFRSFLFDYNTLSLIQQQPNTGQYFPQLARSWARAKDGRTMYFRLDPDARYSDGVPVSADDYLFTFYFFRSPWINDPWQNNFYTENYTSITRFDEHTIAISWKESKPDIEYWLGGFSPIPEHFYREFGPDFEQRYQWVMEPTTGAYFVKPEDLHKGSSVDVTRVAKWWANDKPYYRHRFNVDRMHFEVIRDTDKAFEAFVRGDLDLFGLSLPKYWNDKLPDSSPEVKNGYIAKAEFYNQIPRPLWGLYINTAVPLLANRDIREGIAFASNFDLIDRQYFRGDYVRMQTASDGFAAVPFPGIHARPFSVDLALKCFAKAGFTRRGPDGILVNAVGQRLSFTINTGYDRMRDVLTILRQEAAKAGLEFNLEILDQTTDQKKDQEKHHQIAFTAYQIPVEQYPRYWETYHSSNAKKPNTVNLTNTADPEMDRLIGLYDHAQSMDEIRGLAQQIERRIYDNAAFIPAFEQPFYRVGYWRGIRWPKEFNVRTSLDFFQYSMLWIDEGMRKETAAARASGGTFPSESKVYVQFK